MIPSSMMDPLQELQCDLSILEDYGLERDNVTCRPPLPLFDPCLPLPLRLACVSLYEANCTKMMRTLLLNAKTFGVTIQSDSATITNVPLLNMLASRHNNPFAALLEIVNCTEQMAKDIRKMQNTFAVFLGHCFDK